MDYEKWMESYRENLKAANDISKTAADQNRGLSSSEKVLVHQHLDMADRARAEANQVKAEAEGAPRMSGPVVPQPRMDADAQRRLTMALTESKRIQPRRSEPEIPGAASNLGPQLGGFTPGQPNPADTGGWDNAGQILQAVYRMRRGGGIDERLGALDTSQSQIRAAIGVSTGAEGGFFIPTGLTARMLGNDLEDVTMLRLCDRAPMTTDRHSLPGFQDEDHSSTQPFGITWQQIPEAGTFTESDVAIAAVNLYAHKSGALFLVSNEWLQDSSPDIQRRLEQILATSLRWYVESKLVGGTGAGEPQGIIGADGTLEIAAETEQAASTIVTENIVKMYARMLPGSHGKAVWMANQTCLPMLMTLTIASGTGGGVVSLLQPGTIAGAPSNNILGRPLHLSEHCEALGTAGDILFVDPTLVVLGERGSGVTIDISTGYKFANDQTAFRVRWRGDARPLVKSTLTPAHGDTCSFCVKLAAR